MGQQKPLPQPAAFSLSSIVCFVTRRASLASETGYGLTSGGTRRVLRSRERSMTKRAAPWAPRGPGGGRCSVGETNDYLTGLAKAERERQIMEHGRRRSEAREDARHE